MDYEMNSQHNMLEKPDSRIETKTAIEWENERSAHDVGLTALSSPISSNQNFLSFDAYGNLTAEKPFNDSIISSPLNQSFDFSSPTNLDPLSSADGLFIAKNNSNTPEKNTVKYSKQNKRISFSDTQLKQVIKEELPDSISTSTSRYGRERKKRTSDGFLFGTINFNELRKVTACSTTIPLSPKERGISCENSNGINFDSNPLSTNYDEIVTPGLAPPEKILTSAESSSETEDPNSKDPSISGKKKTKRVKKAALNSLPLTENKAVIHPSPNKGSLSKKLKNNKKYISGLNDTSTKCVGDIHHSNEESIDAKKKKVSESVFDKSFEKIEIESDKIKDQEESERALLLSPNKKDEKPNARKRINTFNSSEEVEVNFTPRKKKKKNSEALSFSPADDQIPPAVLFDMDSDHKNHLESEAEMSYNHTYRIDLGAVGDIVDDLRILKDLTEKNKSESLFMCKETPEEAPPLFYTEPLCKIEFPVKDSLAPSGPRKRGRPRKSLPNEPRKRIKKFTRKSIAMGELNFQNSSKSNLNNESVKNNIKTELGYEEDISNDSVLNISNNSSASVSSPISHTKRGRVVRKPNVTDIADLHERQMQARKLSRMEKEIASSAEESLLESSLDAVVGRRQGDSNSRSKKVVLKVSRLIRRTSRAKWRNSNAKDISASVGIWPKDFIPLSLMDQKSTGNNIGIEDSDAYKKVWQKSPSNKEFVEDSFGGVMSGAIRSIKNENPDPEISPDESSEPSLESGAIISPICSVLRGYVDSIGNKQPTTGKNFGKLSLKAKGRNSQHNTLGKLNCSVDHVDKLTEEGANYGKLSLKSKVKTNNPGHYALADGCSFSSMLQHQIDENIGSTKKLQSDVISGTVGIEMKNEICHLPPSEEDGYLYPKYSALKPSKLLPKKHSPATALCKKSSHEAMKCSKSPKEVLQQVLLSVQQWYQMLVADICTGFNRIHLMSNSLSAGKYMEEASNKSQDKRELLCECDACCKGLLVPAVTLEMLILKAKESHNLILGAPKEQFDEAWWQKNLMLFIDSCGPPAELIADLEEKHPAEYSEGNLVWVALRGHPLWPAIIMQDYKSAQHTRLEVKQTVKGFLSHRVYHVLFLNDNLRVYWMREEYLMPYKGRTDITEHLKSVKKEFNNLKPTERAFQCLLLKSLPHFLKDAEALQASPKLVKWNSAVDEAELATALDKEDRIQKYFTLCTTSVKPEPSCIKYKKKKKKKKDDGILLSSAEIKSEPGSINGSISREASPGIDTRDRRSPSNESDFSGFEDSSSGEVQKRKIEVIKTINDGFDVFYKVKLAAYKKDHHKASDAQIRKLMLDHWTAKNQASKQKFLKTHSEYLEDSDDMLKSRFSSHDELDNQSETGGSIASRRKKSTGDDFDGARGTYRLPRNEKVCYKCEAVSAMPNAADMVRCKGSCCGFYHYSCLGLEVRPDNDKEFKCNECLTGQHLCFICKLGGRLVSRKDTKVKGGSVEKSLGNGSKVADKDVNTEPLAGDDSENKTLVPKNSSQDRKCRRKSNVKKPEKKEEHPSRNNNEMKDTEEINFACPDSVMENNSNGFPDTYLKDSEKPENSEESSRITRSGVNNKSARSEQSDLSEAIFPDTKETEENIKHEQISNLNPEAETGNVNEELNLAGNADDVVKESKPDVNTNKIDLDSSPEGISSILEADQKSQAKAENAEQDSKPEDCANSSTEEEIHRCSVVSCGKFYHLQCALRWPQVAHGWHSGKKLVCPRHMCHMCAATAEDMGYPAAKTGSFTRCLRCPATYHTGTDCLAAGSGEISLGCHVCPRHNAQAKSNHFNVTWCFGCSKGGSLVLCDECPAAYHLECLEVPPSPEEGKGFVCDDCINGKLPVYGDIVWAKIGAYRWWPGQVLHPRFIPDNIENLKHTQGMFCVHFFGSNDYYWVHRGRVFHYQDGDRGCKSYQKSSLNRQFEKALEETKIAFEEEQTNKSLREARRHEKESTKPPPFVRIDTNRPVGNVKRQELELPPKCDCDPLSASPCGPNSNCINRMLMIECAVETCAARERCCNQRFLRRQYPQLAPQRVAGRGWGLHTLQDIQAGDFVIEYVGELVDETELWRRIDYMHQINEENYYFLTITKDIIIDAGPKGNLARFMNHSCEPNCETQKWQVGSETRVGLFALCDIPAGSEVTFNYHFECVGTEKKKCNCGATNCSGYIGAKVQKIEPKKPVGFGKKKKKKKPATKVTEDECFRCGTPGDLILCDLAACPKGYHLECLGLEVLPKGKWVCPWHHCDECGNRAITRCFMCPNSFCKAHMENKMCTSSDVAGGGVSLTYCVGHSEENVREFCDLSKTAAGADGGSESGESHFSGRRPSHSRSSSRCSSPATAARAAAAAAASCSKEV
ncbi:uncharacterized protein LOC108680821 isoform X3 [Hyalella azteca]|uniref:Uncharacterized protein LOC108680821 isoform X3 n=1 Tax=Hyalella azteca TaxID=294128 RepID=A0A979FLT2_HYAAZ|nr:uncharacterized protein LOC108680821 isoform X3 [Hyalella azteca]